MQNWSWSLLRVILRPKVEIMDISWTSGKLQVTKPLNFGSLKDRRVNQDAIFVTFTHWGYGQGHNLETKYRAR